MEIPDGAECRGCAFTRWSDDYWRWACDYHELDYWEPDDDDNEDTAYRCAECLATYPHGATVTIEAKEGK